MTHNEWITTYLARFADPRDCLGKCGEACEEMAKAFPELLIVKGHVHTSHWGKRGHFWLVDSEGRIIDPTARQFPGIFEYEEYKPGDEVRLGVCPDCGTEIWGSPESGFGGDFCNEQCENRYAAYMNDGVL